MRRSRAERGFSIALGLFALVLATYLFLSSPFFQLEIVYITGNTRYSEADILIMAGLQLKQNLFDINLNDVVKRLEADPRIAQARVRRTLPSGLTVMVEDCIAVAVLAGRNGLWLIDADGRIIEEVVGPHGHVLITLPQENPAPVPGEYISSPAGRAALAVVTAMPLELTIEVSDVVVHSPDHLQLTTRTGIPVELGAWRDLNEKLRVLRSLLDQLRCKEAHPSLIDVSVPTSPIVR
jgi:cell division protein FtsQ